MNGRYPTCPDCRGYGREFGAGPSAPACATCDGRGWLRPEDTETSSGGAA